MTGRSVRLIASHTCAAIAMAMPWPALLVMTWSATHSELWLGVVGAARMAPYVVLSWLAGALGDRLPRLWLLRVSSGARAALLVATAVSVWRGEVAVAVVLATLVVAAGTPAYPALAAAMPSVAGRATERATSWLVTMEVSAFVVGPALGGLALGAWGVAGPVWLAAATAVVASLLLAGIPTAQGKPARDEDAGGTWSVLRRSPGAVRAIIAVAAVNAMIGAVGVALIPLAEVGWEAGDTEFGIATAALGFGALAAPALRPLAPGVGTALLFTGLPLCVAAITPALAWAMVPLALLGAGATHVECQVTALLQRLVPDRGLAFALGVTDTAMVSAALIGAGVAPWLSAVLGPQAFLGLCAALTLVMVPLVRTVGGAAPKRVRRGAAQLRT
jgi:MFS family permease